MDKLYLGKVLRECFSDRDKKSDMEDGDYRINSREYARIYKQLKNNQYKEIPNYYLKSYESGYYKHDPSHTYSQMLNQILWDFLLFDEGSRKNLKILNKAIDIDYEKNNTISGIGKSKDVLKYMNRIGCDSYFTFTQHIDKLYGIDADEYYDFRVNKHNIKEQDEYTNKHINKKDTQSIVMSVLKQNKEKIFDGDDIIDTKLLQMNMKGYVSPPVYTQNYSSPILKILKLQKVVFEFSMLDTKKDITKQLNEVYDLEQLSKRVMLSSNKQEFLKMYGLKERKYQLDSILAIKKAFIIYQYRQHCDTPEEARLIYNFHLLLSNLGKKEFGDFDTYMESDDLITKYYFNKEIKQQLYIITSLLNLKNFS